MMNGSVEKFQGFQITSKMYEDAARLFSNNYGIWGPLAEQHMGSFAKNGFGTLNYCRHEGWLI